MRVFNGFNDLPAFNNPVVTIGTFDGVHLGHRKILATLQERAREVKGETVLLTFWPHPRMVLQPDDDNLKLLNTLDEKIALLEDAGLHNLIIIPFTIEFSRLTYLDFVRTVLVDKLNASAVVVGYDHHFGKNREGTYEQLAECATSFGFQAEQVAPEVMEGIAVSSTKIRCALLEGDMQLANKYLGYEYNATGTIVHGEKVGRQLGYPTANIETERYKLLPSDGIYVVKAKMAETTYGGMCSIGYRPTFEGKHKTFEVNIFNFQKDVYGDKINVFFLARLRNEVKFANSQDLILQLHDDKSKAEEYLKT